MQPELEDWSIAASCTHMELQCPPASPPSCAIGDAGVASLVAALAASPQVVFVDLRRNKIGDAGAVALAPSHPIPLRSPSGRPDRIRGHRFF